MNVDRGPTIVPDFLYSSESGTIDLIDDFFRQNVAEITLAKANLLKIRMILTPNLFFRLKNMAAPKVCGYIRSLVIYVGCNYNEI